MVHKNPSTMYTPPNDPKLKTTLVFAYAGEKKVRYLQFSTKISFYDPKSGKFSEKTLIKLGTPLDEKKKKMVLRVVKRANQRSSRASSADISRATRNKTVGMSYRKGFYSCVNKIFMGLVFCR